MFQVFKQIKLDYNANPVLTIHIRHNLNKDNWKDRYMLFNSETATFKYYTRNRKEKTK